MTLHFKILKDGEWVKFDYEISGRELHRHIAFYVLGEKLSDESERRRLGIRHFHEKLEFENAGSEAIAALLERYPGMERFATEDPKFAEYLGRVCLEDAVEKHERETE